MEFVRFSTEAATAQPGYLVDDTVIDLGTVSLGGQTLGDTDAVLDAMADRCQILEAINTNDIRLIDSSDVQFEIPTEVRTVVRLDCTYEHDVTDTGYNQHIEQAGLQELDRPGL